MNAVIAPDLNSLNQSFEITPAQLSSMTVLYVEDDLDIRAQVQTFLQRRVGTLWLAENGREGLEKYLEHQPDIVVTDVRMPHMDGLAMAAKIKQHNAAVPVIVVTAFNDVDYLLAAIESGIDRYVLKPVKTEVLIKALEEGARRVTAQREAELAATVMGGVSEAVVVCTPQGEVVSVNPAYARATGFHQDSVRGKPLQALLRGSAEQPLPLLTDNPTPWHGEAEIFTTSANTFFAWVMFDPVYDRRGHVAYHVLMFYDITERKRAEDRLRVLAHFDVLTGLPNRILFDDRLIQAVLSARRHKETVALLFIDLDKFKQVNDQHGHIIGDLLLREVGQRLGECVRACDTVSRRSGDEFVLLLPGIRDRADAELVAERVRISLADTFQIEGLSLKLSASIGIALFPDDADDPRDLSHRADLAMYHAKKSGGNAYRCVSRDVIGQ